MNVRIRSFSSTPEAAAEASDFILEVAGELGLSEDLVQRLLLVVGEAVANAAHHGNELNLNKGVVVECAVGEGEVRLCISDEGAGILDESLENAELPDDLMQTRGRGLFIMKTLADQIWIEEGGRRLCMTFVRESETRA